MPTPLEQVQAQLPPGGTCWVEELLIRGASDRTINGTHVSFGWRAPGINGTFVSGTVGPYPVAAAADDETFAAAIASLNVAALNHVVDRDTQLAQLQQEKAELQGQLSVLSDQLAAERS